MFDGIGVIEHLISLFLNLRPKLPSIVPSWDLSLDIAWGEKRKKKEKDKRTKEKVISPSLGELLTAPPRIAATWTLLLRHFPNSDCKLAS